MNRNNPGTIHAQAPFPLKKLSHSISEAGQICDHLNPYQALIFSSCFGNNLTLKVTEREAASQEAEQLLS